MIRPTLAITLFRRPKYTKMLFDALDQCYGIDEMPIVISCDHLESKRYECSEVYRLAQEFATKHPGTPEHPTKVYRHNPRLGIDLNKLFIVPKSFTEDEQSSNDRSSNEPSSDGSDRGNFVILLEDDIIPSRDALRYFCAMGERYEKDKSVWSVSGYNRIDEAKWQVAQKMPYATELSRGYCPWGVAIWKDRWDEFFGDDGAQYKSETGREANGLHDRWLNDHHRRVVVPVVARTQSVGGEDGEHTPSAEWHRLNEYNEFGAWLLELPDGGTKPWLDYAGYKYPNAMQAESDDIIVNHSIVHDSIVHHSLGHDDPIAHDDAGSIGDDDLIGHDDAGLAIIEDGAIQL